MTGTKLCSSQIHTHKASTNSEEHSEEHSEEMEHKARSHRQTREIKTRWEKRPYTDATIHRVSEDSMILSWSDSCDEMSWDVDLM